MDKVVYIGQPIGDRVGFDQTVVSRYDRHLELVMVETGGPNTPQVEVYFVCPDSVVLQDLKGVEADKDVERIRLVGNTSDVVALEHVIRAELTRRKLL
jgi:hypothetical protein